MNSGFFVCLFFGGFWLLLLLLFVQSTSMYLLVGELRPN